MADTLYENWWMNMTEQDCGIYYRNSWYPTETSLNNMEYWIVSDLELYLGESHDTYKYQRNWYNKDGQYLTYSQLHLQGYSQYPSITQYYVNTNNITFLTGYSNPQDGYFIDGKWYGTINELNSAGYQTSSEKETLYSKIELKRYSALKRVINNVTEYFIPDSTINYWFTSNQLDSLNLSIFPSVETDWHLGKEGTYTGHGSHNTLYNVGYPLYKRGNTDIGKSLLDSLFGYQSNNTEYDCVAAYVGSAKKYAVGIPAYLEYYYYGSLPPTTACIVAFYHDYNSNYPMYGAWYMRYQTIAVCMGKEADVVKVYNNINEAFSAFRVHRNNTYYYFVLDSGNKEWVSDLASIGYSIDDDSTLSYLSFRYGDSVQIPNHYSVVDVRSNRAYTYPSYTSNDSTNMVFAYHGKDIYTKAIAPAMLNNSSTLYPNLRLFQSDHFNTETNQVYGWGLTYGNEVAGRDVIESAVNSSTQEIGNFFLQVKESYDSSIYSYASTLDHIARVEKFDDHINPKLITSNVFHLPSTLWRYSNSTFTWLGDYTSQADPAYYYRNDLGSGLYGTSEINIFIKPDSDEYKSEEKELLNIITGVIYPATYYPGTGYFFNNQFYSEQQLFNLGYHVINYTKELVVDALGDVSAMPNVNPTKNNFDNSNSYNIKIDGNNVQYNGECAIKLKINTSVFVDRLYKMPSIDHLTSNSSDYCPDGTRWMLEPRVYSASPISPLSSEYIGEDLLLFCGFNGSYTPAYVGLSSKQTLFIDEYRVPEFEKVYIKHVNNHQVYRGYYNASIGYLIIDVGTFRNEQELNNAGYALLQSVTYKRLYYSTSNFILTGQITRHSKPADFPLNNSSYVRGLYEDENMTVPFIYNGGYILVDIDQSTIPTTDKAKINDIYQMPEYQNSTIAQRTDSFYVLSATGNPINPFNASDIGQQLRFFTACNYTSSLGWSVAPTITVAIYE